MSAVAVDVNSTSTAGGGVLNEDKTTTTIADALEALELSYTAVPENLDSCIQFVSLILAPAFVADCALLTLAATAAAQTDV